VTPAEHYAEAERLLFGAMSAASGSHNERYLVSIAQVHATLATVPDPPCVISTTEEPLTKEEADRIKAAFKGEAQLRPVVTR
jgi:hypothetical protein